MGRKGILVEEGWSGRRSDGRHSSGMSPLIWIIQCKQSYPVYHLPVPVL